MKKMVGAIGRKLDRRAIHEPRYKPGSMLCSLEVRDKFLLFASDSIDPISILTAGFYAGLDQSSNNDPSWGLGAAGYGKRFGAALLDFTSARFFMEFAYPVVFSEDPRYYRMASGTAKRRLLHAVGHTFIVYRDDGTRMFNFSQWLGRTSAVALSTTYHPGYEPGFGPIARETGYWMLTDMGFDILREFWPEIAHKLRLPFRDAREPVRR
jgi:hypothetical protein